MTKIGEPIFRKGRIYEVDGHKIMFLEDAYAAEPITRDTLLVDGKPPVGDTIPSWMGGLLMGERE